MIGVTFQPDVDRECYGARGREVNSADSPSPGMAALSQGGSTIVQAVRVRCGSLNYGASCPAGRKRKQRNLALPALSKNAELWPLRVTPYPGERPD